MRYESGCEWTLNYPVTSQDRAQFFTVNTQDGAERNDIYRFVTSWTLEFEAL